MKKLLKPHMLFVLIFLGVQMLSSAESSNHRVTTRLSEDADLNPLKMMVAQSPLPNLRFGSINIHSRTGTYEIIAFQEYDYSVTLFADSAGAKNVHVRAGLENGKVFYDKIIPYISETAPKRIAFSYTMPVGTHTMYIDVDPENQIKEFNENDNRTTRTFIADPRIHVR